MPFDDVSRAEAVNGDAAARIEVEHETSGLPSGMFAGLDLA
jgi:hypothetical protein